MNLISLLMRGIAAALAAVLVQPLVLLPMLALSGAREPDGVGLVAFTLIAVVMVAAVVVPVLGIPAFLLLRRLGRDSWLSAGLLGFLMAALVGAFGFSGWPSGGGDYSYSGNWHGRVVEIYVNGEPTRYAWFQYAESVGYFGLHGLAGALAFYAVWRWCERR